MLIWREIPKLNKKLFLDLRQRKFATFSSLLSEKFSFTINKFNDIHVKTDDVVKFSKETNFDAKIFEDTLKSKLK